MAGPVTFGPVASGNGVFGPVTSGKKMFGPLTSGCSFGFGGTGGFAGAGNNNDGGKKLPDELPSINSAEVTLSLLSLMIPAEG